MADTGYNAGVAFVAIRPSLRGFQSELQRELRGLNPSADVRIRADTSALRREIADAMRGAGGLGGSVRISGDIEGLRAAIFEARLQLEDLRNSRTRVDIDADRSRVRAAISETRAELANLENLRTRPEIDADISAARTAIDEVQAELARLEQQETSPQVDADTAAANARLRELQDTLRQLDGETARVDVQADINNARTRLDQLRGELRDLDGERADVDVIADIAEAEAGLAEMERRLRELNGRRARVDVDSSGIDAAHSSMLRLVTSSVQAASAIALVGSAVPAIAGLAAALASAAGAAGLIPAALGAGGALFGTFKLGLSGISDAWEAVGKAEAASGVGAAAAAQKHAQAAAQVESATVSLQRAERALGEARKDAAREVAAAETAAAERVAQAQQQVAAAAQAVAATQRAAREAAREVTLAVSAQEQAQTDLASRTRDLKYAQDALNGAWVEGTRALQDLQDQADGVALDQRQNVLDLKQARKDLLEAQTTGDVDKIARAQLAVDRLIEQQDVLAKRAERTNEANTKGQAAGVAGTEQVLAAKARIVRADDEVIKAQERLEAQTYAVGQARERAALADQAVSEARARQALADKAVDAARVKGAADVALAKEMAGRRIRSAEESAADAARALAAAMVQTADQGTAASQKLDAAMAKLSPNARSLIRELQRLKPAWDALQLNVQDRLLAGVSGRIGELAGKYLPKLRSMLGGIADGFNVAFHQTADFLGLQKTVDDLGGAFDRGRDAVKIFAGAVKPLAQIFTDFFIVGSEFLPGLAKGFADAANRAADFVRNARETGDLGRWIDDGIHQIKTFFGILGDVGGIAFTVFDAANQSGTGFLDTVKKVTGGVREFLNSDEGQATLKIFFDNLAQVVENLKPGLLAILGAIKDVIKEIAPKLPGVATSFSKIASGVAPILKDIAVQVFDAFATAFDLLSHVPPDVLVGLAGVFAGMVLAKKAIGFIRSFSGIFAAASNPVALAAILGLGALIAAKGLIEARGNAALEKPESERTGGEKVAIKGAQGDWGGWFVDGWKETFRQSGEDFQKFWDVMRTDLGSFGTWWSDGWAKVGDMAATEWGQTWEDVKGAWAGFTGWWDETKAGWSQDWDAFWNGSSDAPTLTWQKIVDWPAQKWGEFTTWWAETSVAWGAGWNGFWQGVADWIGLKWGEVVLWAQTKWGELSTWWAETSAAWQIGWNTFWQTIADWISLKWQEIKDWVVLKWTETSTWLTEQIGGFEVWWNDTWSRVAQWFSDRWEDIKRIGSDAWIWLKTNVWDPMVTFVTVDIPNAFQRAVDGIRAQWDRIRGIIGPPVEWIVNTVYNRGIVPVWNAIATKVGLPALTEIGFSANFNPSGSTAGQSGTNTANRLATGGAVRGPGTGTSDSVFARERGTGAPFWLSNGEHVWTADEVKKAGGHDAMRGIRRSLMAGDGVVLGPDRKPIGPDGSGMKLAGGGAVDGALAWARSQAGKPYQMGGVGPNTWDCSGFMSGIANYLLGQPVNRRRFTTASFSGGRGAGGMTPGTGSAFVIGVLPGNPGHMAGTLGGVNVESSSGNGHNVKVGGAARGATNGMFPYRFFLPQAGGQFVDGGGGGGLGFVVPAWVTEGIAKATALLKGFTNPNGGTGWGDAIGSAANTITKAAANKILEKLNPLNLIGGALGAGTGPVMDQVRSVLASRGWDQGAEWAAAQWIMGKESSGNPTAQNPRSSASGLFQFIDGTWKAYGGSTPRAYQASVPEQTRVWMNYMGKFAPGHDPISAQRFWQAHGWYDEGGVASGRGIMLKQILEPERVLSPRQNVAFEQLVAHATSGYRGVSQRPIQGAEAWGRGTSGPAPLVGEYHSHLHGNATEDRAVQALDHQLRKIRRRA